MFENLSSTFITGLIIVITTALYFGRKYFAGGVCKISKDLTGKVVVITGSNTGIGKETARSLAKMNATVILACRDAKRTADVVNELKNDSKNSNIEFMRLDLSDLSSITEFADQFKKKYDRLDILINNAGVMAIPERKLTKDGFEMTFGTNHLGHFYLTNLLLDVIERSSPSRIINVSAQGHAFCHEIQWDDIMYEKNYHLTKAYFQSKLANILFTKKLQQKLSDKNVKVVSVHPGSVRTELTRNMTEKWYYRVLLFLLQPLIYLVFKSSSEGAQTTLYCALEDQDKLKDGMYYADCKIRKENPLALDPNNAERLWVLSESLISKALK